MTKESKKDNNQYPLPIKTKFLIRLFMVIIIFLTFLSSYFHSLFTLEQKKYNQLEDKYVRVRMMLGREEMQQLIDESYELTNQE
jgi:hypothetical protein